MRVAVVLSGFLHVALFLIALVGLPLLQPEREILAFREIPVDVVEIGPTTIARLQDQPAPPRPQPPKPEPPKPEPPKPEPRPEPPKQEPPPPKPEPQPEPPKPEPPKPEPPPPPKPEPEPEPEPKPEPPKPEPPKPEPPKPEPPKPEPPKPQPPKPEPPKPEPRRSLTNVLRDLERTAPPDRPAPPPTPTPAPQPPQQTASLGPSGDRLSVSEEDALRRQFGACWNVPVGAKGVEDFQAEVRVYFDGQLNVTNVEYVRGNGSLNDPFFRAFVESALRAPRKPQCSRLNLPVEKYGSRRTIVINFSPRDMF